MSAPHVVVVSLVAPSQGTGSGIVLLRHLLKLDAAGWKITVCAPERELVGAADLRPTWRCIPMPQREWWWPPVRDRVYASSFCRSVLIARNIIKRLDGDLPTHILTVLWGDCALSAAILARKIERPLITIIHDQQEFWAPSAIVQNHCVRRNRYVVSISHRVLGVSEEILNAYGTERGKGIVLHPIPGDERYFCSGRLEQPKLLKLFFAGSLHPWQSTNFLALASRLSVRGGCLVLATEACNEVYRRVSERFPETERIEPPKENELVVRTIAEGASACLVSYSMNRREQPWSASSFPSKFVDFSRAGVPILVLAPEESAIGMWCRRSRFEPFASDIAPPHLDSVIEIIQDEDKWRAAASCVRSLATGEFSAQEIHRTFLEALSSASADCWREWNCDTYSTIVSTGA